jgi:hypothetical protein
MTIIAKIITKTTSFKKGANKATFLVYIVSTNMDIRPNTDSHINISNNEKIEVIQCYEATCINVRHTLDTGHTFNLKCWYCIAFR